MFTGIVETMGDITHLASSHNGKKFLIEPILPFGVINIGESIAINGVCLTVTHCTAKSFSVTAVPETLSITNLSQLSVGDKVNLERSLKQGERIGGHYVQGHVDGMGQILSLTHDEYISTHETEMSAQLAKIMLPKDLSKYVIKKGYIAIDGMSITVIDVNAHWFTVTFIPHTSLITIVNQYKLGSWVNIEVDMMGKYIEKLIGGYLHEKF